MSKWATKCDRCGKYFDYSDADTADAVALMKSVGRTDDYHQVYLPYDLCPECVKSFDDWFKGGKN